MILVIYSFILFALAIYSYSQIDLNLTLSSNSIYQNFQNQLISLGYFNRPLSTYIYLFLLFLLLSSYFLLLYLVKKNKLSKSNIFWLIVLSCGILLFSYPAFSHDLFNYVFDARIVTKYHLNPYFFKANDFSGDLWIRFMHWTHRTYPYGPVWLFITLPFSFLGGEKFVVTLVSFKLMFTVFHLGNIYLIYKILDKINPKGRLLGIVFYAFNPLIIIESLLSPHNEVMMLFFLLASLYFIFSKGGYWWITLNLLLSAGVKFITLFLLPLFIFFKLYPKPINHLVKLWLIFFLLIPVIFWETYYREPYPWYFIILLGIGSLLINNKLLQFMLFGLSIGALLRYAPFLYFGDYSITVNNWQWWLFILPLILSVMTYFILSNKRRLA